MKQFSSIDKYISTFPKDIQDRLNSIRETVRNAAPDASEKISYGIPTLYLNGNLLHYAAYKSHIGFYPGSAPISDFSKELESYQTSKGTVKFPHTKPLPLNLIKNITLHCVERNSKKK
jgi:uncharacterized protein YdhG (YjbR/CyaY superfamily)